MLLLDKINQLIGRGWKRVQKVVWISPDGVVYKSTDDAYKEINGEK